MRLLKDRAQYKPLRGRYRVFLIDRLDRANEQAANSLLKTLEEPPEHLMLLRRRQNQYDLLPTIRSRSVILQLSRLTDEEMAAFSAQHAASRTGSGASHWRAAARDWPFPWTSRPGTSVAWQ